MKAQQLKSMALAALATVSFAAPMALASPAAADPPRHHDRYDRDYDNRDDRRDEHRAYRDGYRDGRDNDRYDRREHRREWRRGDRASYQERQYWRSVDYRDYRDRHWRAPPRGYHYVRDNRTGDYLLVGIATGVILGVIASR